MDSKVKNNISSHPSCIDYLAPFVGCFRTERSRYIYDVNMNEVIQVNDTDYNVIIDAVKNNKRIKEYGIDRSSMIPALFEEGYLSSNRPSEIQPIRCTKKYRDDIKRKLKQCILEVTSDCNLNCTYCERPVDHKKSSKRQMEWPLAKKAIEYFFNNNQSSERIALSFYGGEPLLNIQLIKKCIEYARNKEPSKRLHINITTNATLIDNDIANYLWRNQVSLTLSIDGPCEIHNRYRVTRGSGVGSYEAAMKGVRALRRAYGNKLKLSHIVNCVYGPQADLLEVERFFADSTLFRGMIVQYNAADCSDDKMEFRFSDSCESVRSLMKAEERFQKRLFKGKLKRSPGTSLSTSLFEIALGRFYGRDKSTLGSSLGLLGMCEPGLTRMFVRTNGDILPCERVGYGHSIGSIADGGIDANRAISICSNMAKMCNLKCTNCVFCRMCSLCLSSISNELGEITESRFETRCLESRIEYSKLLLLWARSLEVNPSAFDYLHKPEYDLSLDGE